MLAFAMTFIVAFAVMFAFAPVFAATPFVVIITVDLDKVNRLPARIVFGAMLGPFFSVSRRHMQIQWRLLNHYWCRVNDYRLRID